MMGFPVGQITRIHAMPPGDKNNVLVEFEIRDNYFRYLRTGGSYLKVNSAGFLNQRQLEVTRGTNAPGSYAIVVTQPLSILKLEEAKRLAAAAPGDWQLGQDVFIGETNLVFHTYDAVETVLDDSNAQLLAQCTFESNSIYVFNNKVNRDRIVASWDGRVHSAIKFSSRVMTRPGCARWKRRRFPTSCRRWSRRCKRRCRECSR